MSTPRQFYKNVFFLSTADTTNTSTGAVIISGGLSVQKNINTTGITVGNLNFTGSLFQNGALYTSSQWTGSVGSLLSYTSGGVSISNATIGGLVYSTVTASNLMTQNLNLGIASLFSGSFVASNNVITPTNVTGLAFSNANIRSFNITINTSILVSPGTNLFSVYNLIGSQTDSGWSLFIDTYGDISGIVFTINSSGQILYTSTNISNFVNSTFRYRVEQYTASGTYTSLLGNTQGSYIMDTIQINNTSESTPGSNNGGLYLLGGSTITKNVNILSTSDTVGLGTGGSLTVLGGASISKNLIVGAGATFGGSLIPNTTLTQDLGSATNRWRDIFLSGNTIDLGGTLISTNTTGTIAFGSTVLNTTTTGNIGSSIPNLLSTNISTSTVNASGGITTGALLATSQISTNNLFSVNTSIGNLVSATGTFANKVGTNQTVGTINVTNGITTGTLLATSQISTNNLFSVNTSIGNLVSATGTFANKVGTNQTVGTINVTNGITTGTLLATSQISTSSINATNGTISNFAITNNLLVGGSLIAVNVTTLNLIDTNISTGTINASTGITTASLLNTIGTITNLGSTNISTGTINASTGITSNSLSVNGSTRIFNITAFSTGTLTVIGPGNVGYLPATTTIGQLLSVYGPGGPDVISNIDLSSTPPQSATNFLPSVRFSMNELIGTTNFNILTRNPGVTGTMASRIFIDAAGNIGIGTTTPSVRLDVNGTIRQFSTAAGNYSGYLNVNGYTQSSTTLLNPGLLLFSSSTFNYGFDLGYLGTTYRARMFAPNTADISFAFAPTSGSTLQSGFTERMVIKGDSGFVGIGTTAPSSRLDVNGDIRFQTTNRLTIDTTDNFIYSSNTVGLLCNVGQ